MLDEPSDSFFDAIPQPRIHGCRWGWCRNVFPSNDALNYHVVYEHVRTAQPVKFRDLPELRRAQEGFGESFSLTGMTSGETRSTDGQSFPSQGVSYPAFEHHPQGESFPISKEQPAANHATPPPQRLYLRPELPVTPQRPSQTNEPPGIRPPSPRTSNFRSLSSPMDSPAIPSLPSSPVFGSLVDSTVRDDGPLEIPYSPTTTKSANGGKLHDSPDSSPQVHPGQSSQSSSTSSQANVELQLTQSLDMDVDEDVDGCGEANDEIDGHDHSQAFSKDSVNAHPSAYGQGESGLNTPADLQWPTPPSPRGFLPGSQSATGSQSQISSDSGLKSRENRQKLPSQIERQPGSAALFSYPDSCDVPHSSLSNTNPDISQTHKSQSQSGTQTSHPRYPSTELPSPNLSQSSSWPSQDYLPSFRSGSFKVAQRPSSLVRSGRPSASNADVSITGSSPKPSTVSRPHIERPAPVSQSQHSQSQSSSNGSIADGNSFSYPFFQLQTQAPYQSPSFSQ